MVTEKIVETFEFFYYGLYHVCVSGRKCHIPLKLFSRRELSNIDRSVDRLMLIQKRTIEEIFRNLKCVSCQSVSGMLVVGALDAGEAER